MLRKNELRQFDLPLIIAVVCVVTIGILTIYSAGFDPIEGINSGLYKRQLLWFIVGFLVLIGMTFVDYRLLGDYSLHIYVFILVVTLLTSLFGKPIRNIRAWIDFGFFSIQPSEFMKLSVVLLVAKYIDIRDRDMIHFRELLIPSIITLVPVSVILLQPDFGTAMLFFPILFIMLFIGGADVSHLISALIIVSVALVVPMFITYREWINQDVANPFIDFFRSGYYIYLVAGIIFAIGMLFYVIHLLHFNRIYRRIYIPSFVISLSLFCAVVIQRMFKDYQKKRILVFLNTDLDPHSSGYNIIQAKIAIGSGGFFGKGYLKGTQSQLGFLPEKTSDFIFAVVAEEWGFVGAIILIGLFCFIIYRGIRIALETRDRFGAMLAIGITSVIFFHTMVNIGMASGVMPVTGLPLSFVSAGGSNFLMAMMGVGLLISIKLRRE